MTESQLFTRGIYPRGWPEGPSQFRAECLIEGLHPDVEVTVRLLQIVERQVLNAEGEPVEHLVVASRRYESQEEAVEREVWIDSLPNRRATISTGVGERADLVENGVPVGALVWRSEPLHGTVEAWIDEIEPGLRRVRVDVANRLEWAGAGREQTRMRALFSTKVLMHSPNGAFVSLAHPPGHLRKASAACHNEGLWPVPVGEAGDRRTILASSIHLEDYPQIDPESCGLPIPPHRPRHGSDSRGPRPGVELSNGLPHAALR
jgi:hypothetical protein